MSRLFLTLLILFFAQASFAQGKINRRNQAKASVTTSHSKGTKLSISGQLNGHDYVDLGLPSGRLWATCNIGSQSPSGYGQYFAWAETSPKKSYTKENCKTYDLWCGNGIIKCNESDAGVPVIGNRDYDTATAKWGEGWILPTASDFAELNKVCKWTLKTIDGHRGYLLIGPNGNSIFLPMGGYKEGAGLSQAGTGGFYWTGNEWWNRETSTMFDFSESSHNGVIWAFRHSGKCVRPVVVRSGTIKWTTSDGSPANIKWAEEQ